MRLLVDLQSVNNVVGMHPKGGSILPHSLAPAEAVMLVFFFVLLDCFTVSVLHFLLEREVFWLSFLLPSLFADLCLEHLIGRGSPGQNLNTEHLMLDSRPPSWQQQSLTFFLCSYRLLCLKNLII